MSKKVAPLLARRRSGFANLERTNRLSTWSSPASTARSIT